MDTRLSTRMSQREDMSAAAGSSKDLRVNFENVIKQGLLFKKGEMLKMYSNLYHFYLEKRDEGLGIGPLLKYGRKGKKVNYFIDLGYYDA